MRTGALAASVLCGTVLALGPSARGTWAGCVCTAGDFQTYEIDAFQTFVPGTNVTLTDQYFTNGAFTLDIPKRLAAPANVSGSDPTAPTNPDHLAGYIIQTAPAFAGVSGLVVNNRFGTFAGQLKRPTQLYVPTAVCPREHPPSRSTPPWPSDHGRLGGVNLEGSSVARHRAGTFAGIGVGYRCLGTKL